MFALMVMSYYALPIFHMCLLTINHLSGMIEQREKKKKHNNLELESITSLK